MSAKSVDRKIYLNPHHGAAVLEGIEKRKVGGDIVEFAKLCSPTTQSWFWMCGSKSAAFLNTPSVDALIPLSRLEEGGLWFDCSSVRPAQVLKVAREGDFAPWVERVDTPYPSKALQNCQEKFVSTILDQGDVEKFLGELVAQISEYLTTWFLSGLTSPAELSVVQRDSMLSIKEAIDSGSKDFWTTEIAQTFVMRANGREMLMMLSQISTLLALVSDESVHDVADSINAVATARALDRLPEFTKAFKVRNGGRRKENAVA